MIKEILITAAIFLMAIGIADALGGFVARLFASKRKNNNLIIVPIDKSSEDAEYILRSIAYRFSWGNWDKDSSVLCIYNGEDEEIKKICQAVCENYSFMTFKSEPLNCNGELVTELLS